MEAFQPTGSFKIRGIGKLCIHAKKNRAQTLIASSGGNAGLAVSYSARLLGMNSIVIVPETTSLNMIEKIRSFGSNVIIHGDAWDEANAEALKIFSTTKNSYYIPPFDHPLIWEGNSSLVDELVTQAKTKPDCIVVSVGGGGLLYGILQGLKRVGWGDVAVIAVEPSGACAYYESVKAGKPVKLASVKTVATSLGTKTIAEKLLDEGRDHLIISQLVTDQECLDSCLHFLSDHNILVEPACGATLSMAYFNKPILENFNNIIFIACGGVNVSLAQIEEDRKKLIDKPQPWAWSDVWVDPFGIS